MFWKNVIKTTYKVIKYIYETMIDWKATLLQFIAKTKTNVFRLASYSSLIAVALLLIAFRTNKMCHVSCNGGLPTYAHVWMLSKRLPHLPNALPSGTIYSQINKCSSSWNYLCGSTIHSTFSVILFISHAYYDSDTILLNFSL